MENQYTFTDLVNVNRLDHNYFLPFPKEDIRLHHSYSKILIDNNDKKQSNKNEDSQEKTSVHEENANTLVADGLRLQKAVTYTILPGVRLNSQIYMDNLSYRYYKNVSRNNKIYLVCEKQKNKMGFFCPATAMISVDCNENWIKTSKRHNHLPPVVDIPMIHLRQSIGIAGTKSERKPNSTKQVFDSGIVIDLKDTKNNNFQQSLSTMIQINGRSRLCSANPVTIKGLGELLKFDTKILNRNKKSCTPSTKHEVQLVTIKQKPKMNSKPCLRDSAQPANIEKLELLDFDENILKQHKNKSCTPSPKPKVQRVRTKLKTKINSKSCKESIKYIPDHMPTFDNNLFSSMCKYGSCKFKTNVYCEQCNIHLCFVPGRECFRLKHKKVKR